MFSFVTKKIEKRKRLKQEKRVEKERLLSEQIAFQKEQTRIRIERENAERIRKEKEIASKKFRQAAAQEKRDIHSERGKGLFRVNQELDIYYFKDEPNTPGYIYTVPQSWMDCIEDCSYGFPMRGYLTIDEAFFYRMPRNSNYLVKMRTKLPLTWIANKDKALGNIFSYEAECVGCWQANYGVIYGLIDIVGKSLTQKHIPLYNEHKLKELIDSLMQLASSDYVGEFPKNSKSYNQHNVFYLSNNIREELDGKDLCPVNKIVGLFMESLLYGHFVRESFKTVVYDVFEEMIILASKNNYLPYNYDPFYSFQLASLTSTRENKYLSYFSKLNAYSNSYKRKYERQQVERSCWQFNSKHPQSSYYKGAEFKELPNRNVTKGRREFIKKILKTD